MVASIDEQIRGLQSQKAMLLGLGATGSGSTAVETVSEKGKGKEKEGADGKKKRAKRDPKKPKLPASGYTLFVQDYMLTKHKLNNPTASAKDGFKAAPLEWKKLPDNQREEYNAKAKKMQSDYKKQLDIHNETKLSGIIASPEVATRVSFSQETLSDNLDQHTESTKKKDKKKKRSLVESDGDEAGGSDGHEKKKKKKKDKSRDRESHSSNAIETDDE